MYLGPLVARRRLGAELKDLRKAANMTLTLVAEAIGVSASTVSRRENGHDVLQPEEE